MMYDFKTIVDRKDTGSLKWNEMYRYNPNLSEEVVPFSYADMEFHNPPELMEGLREWLDSAILGYAEATDSYYDSVVNYMKRHHDWKIKKEWIHLSPGVVPALYDIVRAYTKPGEGVILMRPVYYPFIRAVEISGRKMVINELKNVDGCYTIDFDDLEEKAKDESTKILLMCSPHNPVGRVWTEDELKRIGEICIRNNVLIVSDEIHFDFIFPGYKHTVFANISEEFAQNSIICTAPSKSFNLGGVMVSNIIIKNEEIRKRLSDYCYDNNGQWTLNIFAFKIGELAYTKCDEWFKALMETLTENKLFVENYIAENLPQIKVTPLEGTYLMWLDCKALGMQPDELDRFMKEKAHLFMDGGNMFGQEGNGFERLNIACPKSVLEGALERLKVAVGQL